MNKSTFCILPFKHLYADPDGKVRPCCISKPIEGKNLKTNHIADVYNTEPFKKLRLDLVNGVKNDICDTCWDREKVGANSQRIFSNKQYGFDYEMYDDGAVLPDFTSIDVRFSNLCNFKCVMCGPWLSSAHWNGEGPRVVKIKDNIVEELIPFLDDLQHIYFGGGEPLLMPEHYDMLKYLYDNKRDITIKYTTNLSVIKHDVYDLIGMWKKFKGVHLQVSIDGLFEKGENIRKGLDTKKFLKNIDLLKENDLYYTLSYTTGNHNVFDIYEFIHNVKSLKVATEEMIELHNYVTSPFKYSINNMTKEKKNHAMEYLLENIDSVKSNNLRKQIYNLIKFIDVDDTTKPRL